VDNERPDRDGCAAIGETQIKIDITSKTKRKIQDHEQWHCVNRQPPMKVNVGARENPEQPTARQGALQGGCEGGGRNHRLADGGREGGRNGPHYFNEGFAQTDTVRQKGKTGG